LACAFAVVLLNNSAELVFFRGVRGRGFGPI
jgi:hypothetical protein